MEVSVLRRSIKEMPKDVIRHIFKQCQPDERHRRMLYTCWNKILYEKLRVNHYIGG